jgi:hypothetical protein
MSQPDTDYFKLVNDKWVINLDTFLVSDPGIFTNDGFKKIINSEYFNPAMCLCCHSIKSLAASKIVEKLINTLLPFYTQSTIGEIQDIDELKKTLRSWDHVDERIQIINKKLPHIYVTYPQCKYNVIWMYANNSSRKFLREFINTKREDIIISSRLLKIDYESPELSPPIQWPYFPCYEVYIKFSLTTIDIIELLLSYLCD